MSTAKQDEELSHLLTKLYTIRDKFGRNEVKNDLSGKGRKNHNQQAGRDVTMGKGHNGKQRGSNFLELKSSIVDKLKLLSNLIEEQSNVNKLHQNPKDDIEARAEIRNSIQQTKGEWIQLNELYQKEAKKKRSKFTQEDLEVQQALVIQLYREIKKVVEEFRQSAGYAPAGALREIAPLNVDAAGLSDNYSSSRKTIPWIPGTSGLAMTGSQQLQLQHIQDRDAKIDVELDTIGEAVDVLRELARMQGEEVQRQNIMLEDTTQNRMDPSLNHMVNVNAKMKKTLDSVGRR